MISPAIQGTTSLYVGKSCKHCFTETGIEHPRDQDFERMTKLYLTVSDLAWHEVKEYSAEQAIRMVIPKHSDISPLDPNGIGLDRNLTKELECFPTQERNECLRIMEYFTRDMKMPSINTVIKHPKNEERPVDFTSVTPT